MTYRERSFSVTHEVIADVLYDRLPYKAASSWPLEFFQQPIGTAGKTYRETNLYYSGQVPQENRFLAHRIEAIFLPAEGLSKAKRIADVNAAARSGVISFRVTNRIYMQTAPLAACPAATFWNEPAKVENEDKDLRQMMLVQLAEQFRETDYGVFGGVPFNLVPIYLERSHNFGVTVDQLARLPSGQDGELICRLVGKRIRPIS